MDYGIGWGSSSDPFEWGKGSESSKEQGQVAIDWEYQIGYGELIKQALSSGSHLTGLLDFLEIQDIVQVIDSRLIPLVSVKLLSEFSIEAIKGCLMRLEELRSEAWNRLKLADGSESCGVGIGGGWILWSEPIVEAKPVAEGGEDSQRVGEEVTEIVLDLRCGNLQKFCGQHRESWVVLGSRLRLIRKDIFINKEESSPKLN